MKSKKLLMLAPAILLAGTVIGCGGNGGGGSSLKEGEVTKETFSSAIFGCYDINTNFKVDLEVIEYESGELSEDNKYTYKRFNNKEYWIDENEEKSKNDKGGNVGQIKDGSVYLVYMDEDKEKGEPAYIQYYKEASSLYYSEIIDKLLNGKRHFPDLSFDTFEFKDGKYSKTAAWSASSKYNVVVTFKDNKVKQILYETYVEEEENGEFVLTNKMIFDYTYDCETADPFATPELVCNFNDMDVERNSSSTATKAIYDVSFLCDGKIVDNPSFDTVRCTYVDSAEVTFNYDKAKKQAIFSSQSSISENLSFQLECLDCWFYY